MNEKTNEKMASRRDFVLGAGLGIAATALAANGAEARADAAAGARNDSRFNVRDFGAKGDGKASDTAAIQRALDAAGAVQGTVWFPAGVYRCHDLRRRPTSRCSAPRPGSTTARRSARCWSSTTRTRRAS